MKFSIIIPVYNVERYLDQCVRSVLQQTYTNFEVILVDDGSTDSSGLLCDNIASHDSRVQAIHQLNAGASSARNRGIDHASGDYILFLDSDDFWLSPAFLERISSILLQYQADVLEFGTVKFIDGNKPVKQENRHHSKLSPESCYLLRRNKDALFCYLIKNNAVIGSACNKVIKQDLFSKGELRFRNGKTSEDIDWTARLMLSASTWLYINEICYAYRQRTCSVSHSVTLHSTLLHVSNLKYICQLSNKKQAFISLYLSVAVANLMFSATALNYRDLLRLYPSLRPLLSYLAFSPTKRVWLVLISIKLCGFISTMYLLKIAARAIFLKRQI